MTPASRQALEGLGDLSMLKWYVIPLAAYTFYIYTLEMKNARATGNWNMVFAGLTVFGMETIRAKVITVSTLYVIAIAASIFGMGIMDWT